MNIVTSYNIRLKTEYIRALKDTVTVYTDAVRYFIDIVLKEWNIVKPLRLKEAQSYIESVSHKTELYHIQNIRILIADSINFPVI